jgi:hypothetical protein
MKKKMTQKQAILNDLVSGLYVTPMDALREHGCFRLAAVVCDLRKNGYDIRKKTDENKYATYYMKFSFTDNDRI